MTTIIVSPVQHALLAAAARGETARQTAKRMGLTLNAVKCARYRLYRQLGARNKAHAVAIALRMGLLSVPAVVRPGGDV